MGTSVCQVFLRPWARAPLRGGVFSRLWRGIPATGTHAVAFYARFGASCAPAAVVPAPLGGAPRVPQNARRSPIRQILPGSTVAAILTKCIYIRGIRRQILPDRSGKFCRIDRKILPDYCIAAPISGILWGLVFLHNPAIFAGLLLAQVIPDTLIHVVPARALVGRLARPDDARLA